MQYFLTLLTMMILDGVWLGLIAKSYYYSSYGHILRLENNQLQPIWWSALMVYAFLVFGIHYYGLSYAKISWTSAVGHAALFGLVVYGVYDFTCLAIFKDWPLIMTVVDWLWGGVLCGLTSFMVLMFMKMIARVLGGLGFFMLQLITNGFILKGYDFMIQKILLTWLFCASSYAAIDVSYSDRPDYSVVAEDCRQVALKLDYLSRYQERLACVTNLDGASVYVASQYILNYQLKEANALISKAIILTKFAIDIDCHGQDEMREVVERLQTIQKKIV